MNDNIINPGMESLMPPEGSPSEVLDNINKLISVIEVGDTSTLIELGFDPDLLPVMQLAARKAPRVLGTYAHPTELDLYKIVASIRTTNLLNILDVQMDQLFVTQLDTRDPRTSDSLKRPLGIENFGATKEINLLNLKGVDVEGIIKGIIDQCSNELAQSLKARGLSKSAKVPFQEGISQVLKSRFANLLAIKPEFCTEVNSPIFQAQLAQFNKDLAGVILEGSVSPEMLNIYLKNIGDKTLTQQQGYRDLILELISLLIQIKGIDIIKQMAEPGKNDGLVQLVDEGGIKQITVNANMEFEVNGMNSAGVVITDDEFLNLLPKGLPLGKLESLAVLAGGVTMHIGSSHGADQIAINLLNAQGSAKEFLTSLQLGEDGTQGHEGLVIQKQNGSGKSSKKFVPLPLQYLMLGARGVRKLIRNGEQTFENIVDLRAFFFDALVDDVIEILGNEP